MKLDQKNVLILLDSCFYSVGAEINRGIQWSGLVSGRVEK